MSREDVQTNLRIPADLKDQLTASAARDGRSLSAEVAHRIQRAYVLEIEADDMALRLKEMARREEEAAVLASEYKVKAAELWSRLQQMEADTKAAAAERSLRLAAEQKLVEEKHKREVERLQSKIEQAQAALESAEREIATLRAAVENISDNLTVRDVSFLIAKSHEDIAEKDFEIGKLRMQIAQMNAHLRVLFQLLVEGGAMTEEDRVTTGRVLAETDFKTDVLYAEVYASMEALKEARSKVSELRQQALAGRASAADADQLTKNASRPKAVQKRKK